MTPLTGNEPTRSEDDMRYEIRPIADDNCDSLSDQVVAETDDLVEAKRLAERHSNYVYGAGILDTSTQQIDVGFGMGVPCPQPNDDDHI